MTEYALVLAAAGIGARFFEESSTKPKQCIDLLGMPLYMWSIVSFGINKNIGRIVLVSKEELIEEINATIQNFCIQNNLPAIYKKITIISGGKTRQESVFNGLSYLSANPPDYVLVHDAARPFVSQELINNIVEAVADAGAATAAIPVTDTIKEVEGQFITKTLNRAKLYMAQTPQAASFTQLLDGHRIAIRDKIDVTDDASILELQNHPVKIVPSTRSNIKITVKEDLANSMAVAQELLGQINELTRRKNNLNN